jgi:mRNA-degrading endonuclease YafQ of YafQ-DinJ toxin-antitoxin module
MSYHLESTSRVDRKIEKLEKKNIALLLKLEDAVNKLVKNPYHNSLKSHKANTKIAGEAWSSWIDGEHRIIWDFEGEDKIILFDFGTHKEVYQ